MQKGYVLNYNDLPWCGFCGYASCGCCVVDDQYMPAQFTSVALPVRSNDFRVLVGCQLQCSVFRYEIIIEHACIHGFPRIAPAEEDGAVLRRVDERHWRSAVVKGCDHHARAQPDGSDHVSQYDTQFMFTVE